MLYKYPRLAVLVIVASVCGTSAALTPQVPPSCPNSPCCALLPIIDSLQNSSGPFAGQQCNGNVRKSVRLAFHDAIGFSKSNSSRGGGADGSIMIFKDVELQNNANTNLSDIIGALENTLSQYRSRDTGVDVSPGDIIQLAAAVGIGNCPGAPQLEFLLGRPNASMAADNNTIPGPFDSANLILNRFNDAGFSPFEVVALLASHSIATSTFVKPNTQFDCTPQVFDTRFYGEVQGSAQCVGPNMARIASDTNLAQDNRTAPTWQSFAVNNQTGMANAFRDAMAKLAVVGQNTSNMTDCSWVIPTPKNLSSLPV